jgi:hypothetical protein
MTPTALPRCSSLMTVPLCVRPWPAEVGEHSAVRNELDHPALQSGVRDGSRMKN